MCLSAQTATIESDQLFIEVHSKHIEMHTSLHVFSFPQSHWAQGAGYMKRGGTSYGLALSNYCTNSIYENISVIFWFIDWNSCVLGNSWLSKETSPFFEYQKHSDLSWHWHNLSHLWPNDCKMSMSCGKNHQLSTTVLKTWYEVFLLTCCVWFWFSLKVVLFIMAKHLPSFIRITISGSTWWD